MQVLQVQIMQICPGNAKYLQSFQSKRIFTENAESAILKI